MGMKKCACGISFYKTETKRGKKQRERQKEAKKMPKGIRNL